MFRKYKAARGNSGQSTVEYIVLVTAVIGTIILFMNGPNSVFQKKVNTTLDTATEGMTNRASALDNSHPQANFTAPAAVKVDSANVKVF